LLAEALHFSLVLSTSSLSSISTTCSVSISNRYQRVHTSSRISFSVFGPLSPPLDCQLAFRRSTTS
jgi:hypothetical protein